MKTTVYTLRVNVPGHIRTALVSDLHDVPPAEVLRGLSGLKPDIICIPGDLANGTTPNALELLRGSASIAPTFWSTGNHELRGDTDYALAESTGAVNVDDKSIYIRGICVCGLASGFGFRQSDLAETPPPDLARLAEIDELPGFRLLLCHHPEYWPRYIRATGIELTFSGHAHGGQWRLLGRGLFAPGQGIFPKYTSGVYENRLVVSRGLSNNTFLPRINNPTELVVAELLPLK